MMATVMTMALVLTTGSIIAPKKANAATLGPETISAAKASVKEDGSALRFLVTATLPKTYTGDLGIKLTVGEGTEKTVSLKNGAPKLYSYVEDGENVTVGYSVAITDIPGAAASTAIKAVGFAGEGEEISKATEVTRTVKQVANYAGYSFDEKTGEMAYSPFAEAEVTAAQQYQELGKVTYTVGDTCPTGFDVAFTATEGAGVNLTITADTAVGKECDFGFGGSRQKSCSLDQGNWSGINAIGTELTEGTVITFTANAADANKVVDFAFTSIKPTGGEFDDVDLSGATSYNFTGADQYTTLVFSDILSEKIDSALSEKKLSDFEKIVIECDDNSTSGKPLRYSIGVGDVWYSCTMPFCKDAVNGGTIEIPLDASAFCNWGGYSTLKDALDLNAGNIRFVVSTPVAGYSGKLVIKSVRLV